MKAGPNSYHTTDDNERSLDTTIGGGETPPIRIVQILDRAQSLQYVPTLGIPYIMNDSNIGQYWVAKSIENIKTYIRLGLKEGYSGSKIGNAVFDYDTTTDTFRYDRFIQYISSVGLEPWNVKELERYLDKVTTHAKFTWEQAEAFATRCGFHEVLNDFFKTCRSRKVDVQCLLCDPASRLGDLPWDKSNGNKIHFKEIHGLTCGNGVGRCHFPGCSIIFPEHNDKEVKRLRDIHLQTCQHRYKLIPVDSDDDATT
jgi:hypothetical protein